MIWIMVVIAVIIWMGFNLFVPFKPRHHFWFVLITLALIYTISQCMEAL